MNENKTGGSRDARISMRPLDGSAHCFVCGTENPRGLHCRFLATSEGVFTEWTPESWVIGYETRVHGGILATLLDEEMIWTVYAHTGRFGVTAELSLRFRRPVTIGRVYRVEGRLLKAGRIQETEAWICDAEGHVYVTAFSKILLPKDQPDN